MDVRARIRDAAQELAGELIDFRRELHQHPELSFHEHDTARRLSRILTERGIAHRTGVAGTGIVAEINATRATRAPLVVLRTDIDALPITEQTEYAFSSVNPGVMHACGHDIHMTCVLGAAFVLSRLSDVLPGSVRLVFQPAEEKIPGGAIGMIEAGVLRDPVPSTVIGQHINPTMKVGTVGFRPGLHMASADDVVVTIHGRGAHGAQPDRSVDPVVIGAQIITALQQIVSRAAAPETPSVLTFGRFIADGATNVIPNSVYLEGTFRTVDERWRTAAHAKITTTITGIAEAFGARADVAITKGYPCLINDPGVTARLREYAEQYVGPERVTELPLTMGAEDFSYYGRERPACFYNLGVTALDNTEPEPLHSSKLLIDEDCIELGAGLLAWNAYNELSHAAGQ